MWIIQNKIPLGGEAPTVGDGPGPVLGSPVLTTSWKVSLIPSLHGRESTGSKAAATWLVSQRAGAQTSFGTNPACFLLPRQPPSDITCPLASLSPLEGQSPRL